MYAFVFVAICFFWTASLRLCLALEGDPDWIPLSFDSLPGWESDDHSQALQVFMTSCKKSPAFKRASSQGETGKERKGGMWKSLCHDASTLPAPVGRGQARAFFETRFQPFRFRGEEGFFTGYYEPEVQGSEVYHPDFPVPLYALPDDLVSLVPEDRPAHLPPDVTGFRHAAGEWVPYYSRREIEQGALVGRGLELVWLPDKASTFFIHIQGSARIRLTDGRTMRVGFAGRNGHPYKSIGQFLKKTYGFTAEQLTAGKLRQWLQDNPSEADEVMWHNSSFIFFRGTGIMMAEAQAGPEGAMGVPLTPFRSLAVDRAIHNMGLPVWVDVSLPRALGKKNYPLRQLMIAQDTGAAIKGPGRGDIFFGFGEERGLEAGLVRNKGSFVILWPREQLRHDSSFRK